MSILIILSSLQFNQVLSQQSINDSIVSIDLEEVVISTPFNESKNNNIIKVSKLNLEKNNPINNQNLSNSINKLPGISFVSTGPNISKPSIRGLSSNRVVVYNQSIRLENQQWGSEHGLGISGSSVSSVELIKGPMSMLYGSDAIAGVLYLSPEKYSKQNDIKVDYSSFYNSNFNGFTNNLGVKGSINNLSYLIRINKVDNENYQTPDYEVENTHFNEEDIKIGFGYKNNFFESDFRLNYSNTQIGIPHLEENHEEEEEEDEEGHEEESSYQDLNNTILSWNNKIKFDKSELHLTLGHTLNKRKEFGEHEEHDDEEEEEDHVGAPLSMNLETSTVDLKYIFPKSDKFEFIIGGNLLSQENINNGEEILIPDTKKTDIGIFALSHVHLNYWDIMLGIKSDNREIKIEDNNFKFSSLNTSLGFKRNIDNQSILRINLSSGYRAPNLSELFSEGVHHGSNQYEIGNSSLKKENNFQSDLSFEFFQNKNTFGVDLFYNKMENYIYLNPTGGLIEDFPVFIYDQSDANIYGGELYASVYANIKWLSFDSSIEYLKGEKSNGSNLPFISPLTIKHSFKIDLEKNIFEIDFLAKGKQNNVSDFETVTGSYFLANISGFHNLTLISDELNFYWSVNNIFNKKYIDHLSRFKNIGFIEMGRNVSLGLSFKF